MRSNLKKKEILNRISELEEGIDKAREYLQSGAHASWQGFKPFFKEKIRDGNILPPHKDWVKNVFIPSHEKALIKAEKLIDRLESNE